MDPEPPAPCQEVPWYADVDGDGFGGAEVAMQCEPPEGALPSSGDCDDAEAWTNPDAVDLPQDGVDSDCDGVDPDQLDCDTPRPHAGDVRFTEADDDRAMRDFCSQYTAISGTLTLDGVIAESPTVLACLCSVSGDLRVTGSGPLTSIDPYATDLGGSLVVEHAEGLQSVSWHASARAIQIMDNPMLTAVSVGGADAPMGVRVVDNPALSTLDTSRSLAPSLVHIEGNGTRDLVVNLRTDQVIDTLTVRDNPGLARLVVERIEGSVYIEDNPHLTSASLRHSPALSGDLVVSGNDALTYVSAFVSDCTDDAIVEVEGDILVADNPALREWSDDQGCLVSVGGDLVVRDNGAPMWRWLDGLTSIGGSLDVTPASDSFVHHDILPALQTVAGDLTLVDAHSYRRALTDLASVGGDLTLWSNDWRDTLTSPPPLQTVGGDVVVIELQPTDASFWFDELTSVGGDVYVVTPGSFSARELTDLGGDMSLLAADSSANFDVGPAVVPGSLDVVGANLFNSTIDIVEVVGDASLTNLGPFGVVSPSLQTLGLQTVGGSLEVVGPSADCALLGSLRSVAERLYISDCAALEGLDLLETVGDLSVDGPRLTDLHGLSSLGYAGIVDIRWRPQLVSLEGLTSLSEVGLLYLADNESLGSLRGLSSLDTASTIELHALGSLTSLDGLQAVRDPHTIRITNNPVLTDVSALHSAGWIQTLAIIDNPSLTTADAQALADALTITGSITISGNAP